MKIVDIRIGARHRKDMGDIAPLAKSIDEIGLLQPIVVTPDGTLISGARRIQACKMLGWSEVPERVIDLASVVRGEFAENVIRKNFTPSEAVDIGQALEPLERAAAKERQGYESLSSENFTELPRGNALDRVASSVGMSRPTYAKAKAVVDAAGQEPEKYAPALERMDKTGNVSGAYKDMVRIRKSIAKKAIPDNLPSGTNRYQLIHADIQDGCLGIEPESVDVIITDPPYPRKYTELYGILAIEAARASVCGTLRRCVYVVARRAT